MNKNQAPLFALAGAFVQQRFSQMELNKRTIVYIINPDRESLSDSLEFRVSDPLGNTGPSHMYEKQKQRLF